MGIAKWRDLQGTLNGNYTREQYNNAMATATDAIRRNAPRDAKLKNQDIRALAQKWLVDAWSKPTLGETPTQESVTAQSIAAPTDPTTYQAFATKIPTPAKIEPAAVTRVVEQPAAATPSYVFDNYTQADLDGMEYGDAFKAARKAGQKTFTWRVGQNKYNKSGVYGTKLASEVTPPGGQGRSTSEQTEYEPIHLNILPWSQVYDTWNRTTNRAPRKKTETKTNTTSAPADTTKNTTVTDSTKVVPSDSTKVTPIDSSSVAKSLTDSTSVARDSSTVRGDSARVSINDIRNAVDSAKLTSDSLKTSPIDTTKATSDSLKVVPSDSSSVAGNANIAAKRDTIPLDKYISFKPYELDSLGYTSDPVISSARIIYPDGSMERKYSRLSQVLNRVIKSGERDSVGITIWPNWDGARVMNFKIGNNSKPYVHYLDPGTINGVPVYHDSYHPWNWDKYPSPGELRNKLEKDYIKDNSDAFNDITNNYYNSLYLK